jgi:hypothetical protein
MPRFMSSRTNIHHVETLAKAGRVLSTKVLDLPMCSGTSYPTLLA